ncbi:MAG: hypothetical protein GY817_04655 [bacterium]|nr:hypothetical protein [bacterium]
MSENLESEEVRVDIIDKLLRRIKIKNDKNEFIEDLHIDHEIFRGNILRMLKVIRLSLEVNYSDFLDAFKKFSSGKVNIKKIIATVLKKLEN